MTATVVMLAGGLRPGTFQSHLGFPVAGMPLEPDCTLLEAWLRRLDATPELQSSERIVACSSDRDRAWFAAETRRLAPGTRIPRVVVDPRHHRGVAGMLVDLCTELGVSGTVIVVELNSLPPGDLGSLFAHFDPPEIARAAAQHGPSVGPTMCVGVGRDDRWSGVYRLHTELLESVTRLGYVDLKEQLIPQLLAKGHRIEAAEFGDTSVQLNDRRNYLRALRIWRSRQGLGPEQTAAISGFSVVCPGTIIEDGAHIADSAVLPGAVVGEGAVIARSVIGPMIQVPAGAVIVDSLLADASVVSSAARSVASTAAGLAGGRTRIGDESTAMSWGVQS